MTRTITAATLCGLVPLTAAAQTTDRDNRTQAEDVSPIRFECAFGIECLDDECNSTDYRIDLAGEQLTLDGGDMSMRLTAEDMAQSYTLRGLRLDGVARLNAIDTPDAQNMLTIWPDGTARNTIHNPDPPMAITYLGRCEEAR